MKCVNEKNEVRKNITGLKQNHLKTDFINYCLFEHIPRYNIELSEKYLGNNDNSNSNHRFLKRHFVVIFEKKILEKPGL